MGTNLRGAHGKGAALHGRRKHGAVLGQGEGLQGRSYGIPTKGMKLEILSPAEIQKHVKKFLYFAAANMHLDFFVTRIGCGLAGFTDEEIAPFFVNAPMNCQLPEEWIKILEDKA